MTNVSSYNSAGCGGCGSGGGNAYPALSRLFVNSIEPCVVNGTILLNQGQVTIDGTLNTTTVNGILDAKGSITTPELVTTGTITTPEITVNGAINATGPITTPELTVKTGTNDILVVTNNEVNIDGLTTIYGDITHENGEITTPLLKSLGCTIGDTTISYFTYNELTNLFEFRDDATDVTTISPTNITGTSLDMVEINTGTLTCNDTLTVNNSKDIVFTGGSSRILYAGDLFFRSGSSNRFRLASSGQLLSFLNVNIHEVAAPPEGVVSAKVGSIALNTSGSAGTSLYVKETGTGNTGWKARNEFTSITASGSIVCDSLGATTLTTGAGDSTLCDSKFTFKNDTGRLGIGIAAPTEKLDVVGNIKASGTITAGSSLALNGAITQSLTAYPPSLNTQIGYSTTQVLSADITINTGTSGSPGASPTEGVTKRVTTAITLPPGVWLLDGCVGLSQSGTTSSTIETVTIAFNSSSTEAIPSVTSTTWRQSSFHPETVMAGGIAKTWPVLPLIQTLVLSASTANISLFVNVHFTSNTGTLVVRGSVSQARFTRIA